MARRRLLDKDTFCGTPMTIRRQHPSMIIWRLRHADGLSGGCTGLFARAKAAPKGGRCRTEDMRPYGAVMSAAWHEVWRRDERRDWRRCRRLEMQGGAGRCRQMQADAGRYDTSR